ncbi:MAG: hypothetical protein U1F52_12070 [Burkholderiales bacterium]
MPFMGLECVAGAEASGSLMHHIVFRILLSDWAVAAGELELAGRTVDELRHWIARMHAHRYEPSLRMAEAHLAWERGAVDEAERLVAHALHLAKDRGGLLFLRWLDTAMPKLLPLAIERGIEPAIVRRLVDDYGVAPPPIRSNTGRGRSR